MGFELLVAFLFPLVVAPSVAGSALPFPSHQAKPVGCPALTEAPKELVQNPKDYDRIVRYLSLVDHYCRDAQKALGEIDGFPWSDFNGARGYLAHRRDQMLGQAVNKHSLYGGVSWFVRVVQTAAMLHLDRALREPSGTEIETSHLNWSRELVRLLVGVEDDVTYRRDWYVAVTAHLHGGFRFLELDEYLSEARTAFPHDPQVLLSWGLMRETQAFHYPRVYALFNRFGRSHLRFPPPPEALPDAERSFREALELDASLLEARVHLGRVLLALQRPDEALRELDAVRDAQAEPRLAYLASLLAGLILDGAGRVSEAVTAYRVAASLYPTCQIGTLALSYEMRKAGDRDEALTLVRQALANDSDADCLDPWWLIDLGLAPQVDAMVDRLRARVRQ